jgi:hypothetical protein
VGFTGMVAWLQGVQDNLGTYSTSNMQQSTFQ